MLRIPGQFSSPTHPLSCSTMHSLSTGRGRSITEHPGNQWFRRLVTELLPEYSVAHSRSYKTELIYEVIARVKKGSPIAGGFVKFEKSTKRWFAIDELATRTTTAQAFRDALSNTYRSSRESKRKCRSCTAAENGPDRRRSTRKARKDGARSHVREQPAFDSVALSPLLLSPKSIPRAEELQMRSLVVHDMPSAMDQKPSAMDQLQSEMDQKPSAIDTMLATVDYSNNAAFLPAGGGHSVAFSEHQEAPSFGPLLTHLSSTPYDHTDDPFEPTPLPLSEGDNSALSSHQSQYIQEALFPPSGLTPLPFNEEACSILPSNQTQCFHQALFPVARAEGHLNNERVWNRHQGAPLSGIENHSTCSCSSRESDRRCGSHFDALSMAELQNEKGRQSPL